MKPFTYFHWHAWQGQGSILLSDEINKTLRSFDTPDAAVDLLFFLGHKEAARALNRHIKES